MDEGEGSGTCLFGRVLRKEEAEVDLHEACSTAPRVVEFFACLFFLAHDLLALERSLPCT